MTLSHTRQQNERMHGGSESRLTVETRQRRVLRGVLAINLSAFVLMAVGAWLSGSSALLSGTLDNLGDALTYALSLSVIGASVVVKARVALLKGVLILGAALAVGAQIVWRAKYLEVPLVETTGWVALLNLVANGVCLGLLAPIRHDDVNMNSVWECSRNDVFEGFAVVATAGAVALFDSGLPDLLVAGLLVVLFLRSAARVLRNACRELAPLQASGYAPSGDRDFAKPATERTVSA